MKKGFTKRVYKICKKIPKGKVSTYKIIAEALGTRAYRAVGNALNKNPYKEVPCHRVVGSSGYLTGFAHGLRKKSEMLRKEGVKVKDNKFDLSRYLYKTKKRKFFGF